jgi:hypothetical protein
MKNPTAKIPLPVLITLLIPPQEAVAIGLLIKVATAKDRAVSIVPAPEIVRAHGVVALSAASIVRAR